MTPSSSASPTSRCSRGLSRKDLEAVAEATDDLHVAAGRVLAREGDAAYVAYVIVTGQAAISVGRRAGRHWSVPVRWWARWGSSTAAPERPRSQPTREMDVYVIEPGRFGPLLDRPEIAKALLLATIKRLRQADQLLHRH